MVDRAGRVVAARDCADTGGPALTARLREVRLAGGRRIMRVVRSYHRDADLGRSWDIETITAPMALDRACKGPATSGREHLSLEDIKAQYAARVAISGFESMPLGARAGHVPLVLFRLTRENLASTRTDVAFVGCDTAYRNSDIVLAPHERRVFTFTRPSTRMFQGHVALACFPGPVTVAMQAPRVRPYDVRWDQPERVVFLPCQGPFSYTTSPIGNDACVAFAPTITTRGPGDAYQYWTYLDQPIEVTCRDGASAYTFHGAYTQRQMVSWADPIRVPLGADRSARDVTCTLDPKHVLEDVDRSNNVLTLRIPARP